MKIIACSAALLVVAATSAAAQDVTPAIDPGLAATGAANREALELDAARAERGGRSPAAQRARRAGRPVLTEAQIERRALRQAERREARRAERRAARGW